MTIGNREFDFKNDVYVMGILNTTPDSFSDGGRYNSIDGALKHTQEMIDAGADIIDAGGESTRPGYTIISDEEEISRVVPVIQKIKENFDIPVSVDTYKSKVAMAAIEAGADMVNDIWGLKYDADMAKIIAESNVACCLMHNRDVKKDPYNNFLTDVINDLKKSADIAHEFGISDDRIILDPGVGFAKTAAQNLEIINNLEFICNMGYPVLLGTSRKSVIGAVLNLPADDRIEGTIATNVIGVIKGCSLVRVHDVRENKRAVKMAHAVAGSRSYKYTG